MNALQYDRPFAFRRALNDAVASPASRASVIADDRHECGLPGIPPLLAAIQAYLAERDVQPGDCLTLELANSVPSALTALACFDAEYSIMLMPAEGLGARAVGSEFPAPRFSRWIVTVRDALLSGERDLGAPATYLEVRPNPGYDPASACIRDRDRALMYLRTSGSLGSPKLVVRSYARFLTNVLHARERLGLRPSHRAALPIPIFHAFGLGPAFLGCVLAGASVDLQDRSNLLRYLERERRFRPNVAFVTPSFCEILVRGRRASRPYDFMVTGGDGIGRTTFFRSEELHGPLINAYGSTEMGFVFCGDLGMPAELRFRTVGRPLPGVLFRVVEGPASSDPSVGTLQIRNPYGFEGYVDLNGAALHPEGAFDGDWYCSADLAKQGPDGTLEILGRADLTVNRNGLLLTFADVEAVLREIEGIAEAAVAVGSDGIRGRTLVAFCALGPASVQSEAQLRAELANRVPAFAVPEQIRIVSALPRLPNGKIDRAQLAAWALADSRADLAQPTS